jgi:hypothetical protein
MVVEQSVDIVRAMLPKATDAKKPSTFAAKAISDAHSRIMEAERDRLRIGGHATPQVSEMTVKQETISHDELANRIARLVAETSAPEDPGKPES